MRYRFNLLSSLLAIFAVCYLVFTPFTAHSQGKPDEREGYSDKADADVLFVKALENDDSTWTFLVTLAHPDTGWDDYADGWDVLTEKGNVIKPDDESTFSRLLLHPHAEEQPFTRSQSGILLPADAVLLTVRAHDIVDGFGGREIVIDLRLSEGTDFEIHRKKD